MIITTECLSMNHNSNEANHKVYGNLNTRHANSNILITTPVPPLLDEIFFKSFMSCRFSNLMVNLKKVLDAVFSPMRLHHLSNETIMMVEVLIMPSIPGNPLAALIANNLRVSSALGALKYSSPKHFIITLANRLKQ